MKGYVPFYNGEIIAIFYRTCLFNDRKSKSWHDFRYNIEQCWTKLSWVSCWRHLPWRWFWAVGRPTNISSVTATVTITSSTPVSPTVLSPTPTTPYCRTATSGATTIWLIVSTSVTTLTSSDKQQLHFVLFVYKFCNKIEWYMDGNLFWIFIFYRTKEA